MPRNPLQVQIHIARRDLALDGDTYRAVLARITGRESSAELTDARRPPDLRGPDRPPDQGFGHPRRDDFRQPRGDR